MVLRILKGQSLKMSVIVVTIRNNNNKKNYNIIIKKITIEKRKKQQQQQVEITMGNSIQKTNIRCIKSGNKYRASDKI